MKSLLVVLLFLQVQAFAQIQIIPNITLEREQREVGLDLLSLNQWMESSKTEAPSMAAENLAIMLQTMQGNYKWLQLCNDRFSSRGKIFYSLNLSNHEQKAIMKLIRVQLEFVENSFTAWIFPTVTERRQAAVASAFQCLDSAYIRSYDTEKISEAEECADKFSWSQPMMSRDRAYKAILAMISIQRFMMITSCSDVQGDFAIRDEEMVNDYIKIREFVSKYFTDRSFDYEIQRHLPRWIGRFHKL